MNNGLIESGGTHSRDPSLSAIASFSEIEGLDKNLSIPTTPRQRNGSFPSIPYNELGPLSGGRLRFFSYAPTAIPFQERESASGAQALATLFDYWGVAFESFEREFQGSGLSDDGHLHYPPPLVRTVHTRHPPGSVAVGSMVTHISTPATMRDALDAEGIRCDLDGEQVADRHEGQRRLEIWLRRTGRPVVCLISLADTWPQLFDDWFGSLHWVFVHGFTREYVILSVDGVVYASPWGDFLRGWHCRRLEDSYHFSAIYTFR